MIFNLKLKIIPINKIIKVIIANILKLKFFNIIPPGIAKNKPKDDKLFCTAM